MAWGHGALEGSLSSILWPHSESCCPLSYAAAVPLQLKTSIRPDRIDRDWVKKPSRGESPDLSDSNPGERYWWNPFRAPPTGPPSASLGPAGFGFPQVTVRVCDCACFCVFVLICACLCVCACACPRLARGGGIENLPELPPLALRGRLLLTVGWLMVSSEDRLDRRGWRDPPCPIFPCSFVLLVLSFP